MRKANSIPDINSIFTKSGSRTKLLYTSRFDGSRLIVEASGSIDIQDAINAYAPYCDIRYMLSRLKVGDSSVLKASAPIYGDFTTLPSNAVDAVNLIHDVERRFSELPEEERKSCNNDWRVFFTKLFDPVPGDIPDPKPNLDVKE